MIETSERNVSKHEWTIMIYEATLTCDLCGIKTETCSPNPMTPQSIRSLIKRRDWVEFGDGLIVYCDKCKDLNKQ